LVDGQTNFKEHNIETKTHTKKNETKTIQPWRWLPHYRLYQAKHSILPTGVKTASMMMMMMTTTIVRIVRAKVPWDLANLSVGLQGTRVSVVGH
jgi:hypothetical protein